MGPKVVAAEKSGAFMPMRIQLFSTRNNLHSVPLSYAEDGRIVPDAPARQARFQAPAEQFPGI